MSRKSHRKLRNLQKKRKKDVKITKKVNKRKNKLTFVQAANNSRRSLRILVSRIFRKSLNASTALMVGFFSVIGNNLVKLVNLVKCLFVTVGVGVKSVLRKMYKNYKDLAVQKAQKKLLRKQELIESTKGRIIKINLSDLKSATNLNLTKPKLKNNTGVEDGISVKIEANVEAVDKKAPTSRALTVVPLSEIATIPAPIQAKSVLTKTFAGKLWSWVVVGWLWLSAFVKWASKTILRILMVVILIAILIGLGIFYYLYTTGPDVTTMMSAERIAQTTIIYDRTGEVVLYEMHGEENRKRIEHSDIPEVMRKATIAAEDDAFYTHFGIDPFSIARAVKENLLRGRLAQGGSTVTQQLARNVFLTRDKTLERKVREAVLAIKIERNFSKDDILDAYLNVVPYGMNAYGIQAASEIYFGKNARELSLDEAAMLASLPKATTTFSPYGSNTGRLIARQKIILERMRELSLVPGDDIDEALRIDTLQKVQPFRQKIIAPHFVFAVIEQLEQMYGRELLERGGLRVTTTIDLDKQAVGEDVVARGVARNVRWGAQNASLVAVDPRNGEVLVMVGSKDYYAKDIDGQVNVATRLRQPGSAFKPLAYAAAFEKGYQPETLVWDLRTSFGSDGTGKQYMPGNYTGRFNGLVSLRSALAQSLNIPAVKTLYLAGIDHTIELAHRLGITSLNDRSRYGLALVLGGAEVKLVDLTAAYGVFANDGVRAPMRLIHTISDYSGAQMYDGANTKPIQVLRPDVARKISSVLSDNVARTPAFGRNNPLVVSGRTVAAKTGTTQNYRDAWTVGYAPELAVGVWAGNNSGKFMYQGAAGTYAAAPIWNDFMTQMLSNTPNTTFGQYVPVKSQTPMIAGKMPTTRIINISRNGKKGSKRDSQKTRVIYRSILYYIDKDKPLTGAPANLSDPMFRLWEAALSSTKK